MSEPKCVCGRAMSAHDVNGGVYVVNEGWKCGKYRECLDWPDVEGWWWMQHSAAAETGVIHFDGVAVWVSCCEYGMDRELAKELKARFTRCESSPFAAAERAEG